MTDKVPCCMADAARKVKKLNIGGTQVGISRLNPIIQEVFNLGLHDEKEIKNELLKRIKIYNYVSPSAEQDYAEAVFGEYKKQIMD